MHVFPLSRSRLLVEVDGARLVYARVEKPERWFRLSRCSKLLPRVIWIYAGPGSVVYQYVEGQILADEIVEDIVLGRMGSAAWKAWLAGYWLARLHSDLEGARCFEGKWDTRLLVEDRCRLASTAGLPACPQVKVAGYTALGHGDPHLYQAIMTGEKIVFIDLDGEPDSTVPGPAEYDIAAAARSIDYAASMAGQADSAKRLVAALLAGYCVLRRPSRRLLEASYLARLVYEYYFEKTRNTGLDWVPSRALEAALAGKDPVLTVALRVVESCRE